MNAIHKRPTKRWISIAGVAIATAWGSSAAAAGPSPDRIASIDVEGTVLQVRMASGKVLNVDDLVGATLTLSQPGGSAPMNVRIESIKIDPTDPDHEVMLYHLLAVDPVSHATAELCEANADGERWGFPLRGQWDAEGRHLSDEGYTMTCSDGAQGKCVRFGYKPWKSLADGTPLEPHHQACVRMVRADYCGGHGTTRNGMLIDIYDSIGMLTPDPRAQALGTRFEAAWGPGGAICVAHTRVPENITLEQLASECPRLKDRVGEQVCTPESARAFSDGALLFNNSR